MIGYVHRVPINPSAPWVFNGTESDWSNTQTVTIGQTFTSPAPTAPISPAQTIAPSAYRTTGTVTEAGVSFGLVEIALLVAVAVIVALVIVVVTLARRRITPP